MSYADKVFVENVKDILENGVWDTDKEVRPHWEDGTPAHTVKKFCVVNRYDLQKEFPIITVRRTFFKSAIDEILWIWQKKSNNVHDLKSRIWDSWADENGSIGKAYGYQLAKKSIYKEGEFDQVDRVLFDLKNNPQSRRIMTNIYNFDDLHEFVSLCIQHDFQRFGRHLKRYSEPKKSGHTHRKQLERRAIRRAFAYVCTGFGAESGRTRARHRRRSYLRPSRADYQGSH